MAGPRPALADGHFAVATARGCLARAALILRDALAVGAELFIGAARARGDTGAVAALPLVQTALALGHTYAVGTLPLVRAAARIRPAGAVGAFPLVRAAVGRADAGEASGRFVILAPLLAGAALAPGDTDPVV